MLAVLNSEKVGCKGWTHTGALILMHQITKSDGISLLDGSIVHHSTIYPIITQI